MIGLRILLVTVFGVSALIATFLSDFGQSLDGTTAVYGQNNLHSLPDQAAVMHQQIEGQLAGLLEEKKLTASDAQSGDSFGFSVAASGDLVVVGAVWEDGGPGDPLPETGAAYIFERNQGGANNWGEVARLTATDTESLDQFGSAVAVSGDTVVVGANGEDGGPGNPLIDAGAAYIFERNQGGANNWGQVAKLTASDAQTSDLFGSSVAISNDTVIVGAFVEDGGLGDPLLSAGAAYIFERNQGGANNWGEVVKLTASDTQIYDEFGGSVAASGDTIVVAAAGEDGGPGDPMLGAGAVYIFERNQGGANNWGEASKLTASDAQILDTFGSSVAVSDDTVVVGAIEEDGGPGDPLDLAGAAYIFERNQGGANNWGQVTKLTASDAQTSDLFGSSAAISGDMVIVGAYGEDAGPGDPLDWAGAIYVFKRNLGGDNNWGEVFKLTAGDAQASDRFGWSAAVSGDTVIVGASYEDGGPGDPLTAAGAAYVFTGEYEEPTDVTLTSFERPNLIGGGWLWGLGLLVILVVFVYGRKKRFIKY